MVEPKEKFIISAENQKQIDKWIQKYPPGRQQSAVVIALLLVQEQNKGWLSEPAMEAVAEYLSLPPIVVFEAATFYDMYNLKPIGKHKINICTNLSCMLRGSQEIVDTVCKRLNIELGETTSDNLFTVREVECLAACAAAPVCQIDDKHYHENLTPEKINALIDEMSAKENKA